MNQRSKSLKLWALLVTLCVATVQLVGHLAAQPLAGSTSHPPVFLVVGAQLGYSVTTSGVDLANVWRKIQAGIVVAAQFGVEEWNDTMKLENFEVNWSAREITVELDISQGYGAASIKEGGKEANPSTPTTVTATVTWIFINKRFTLSKTAEYIQRQQGTRGQLESQLKWQSKKAVQAIRAKVGDMFYGFSTGTTALINSAAGAPTYTIKDMFGIAGLGGLTHNRRVVDQYYVGSRVAFLNPAGPALRGMDSITAIDRTVPNITTANAIAAAAANDLVVFADNVENTTLAGGTERNLDLIGLLDGATSTSVHGVSSAAQPKWAAFADTAGGRFNGIRLRKMKQAINNVGGGEMTDVWWANGVENDVVAQLQAGLRFTDSYGMEMDGAAKSKGVNFRTSRRVPDTYAFALDKRNSVRKMVLLPEPGSQAFDDGYKMQDDSGTLFGLDYPCALVYQNRANIAYASALTQS